MTDLGETGRVTTDPDAWEPLLDDLHGRRTAARAMGGKERLARHRDKDGGDRLDARARIDYLLDDGSFREIGTLVEPPGDVAPADGIVTGSGAIDGRPVMIGSEDFTVLGGSIGSGSTAKRYRIAELAERDRMPLVMLLEGAGHRPPGTGVEPGRVPTDLHQQARLSGRVPLVTGILGPSAGHGALVAPLSDYSVMTRDAAVFTAGPPVVKFALGEESIRLSAIGSLSCNHFRFLDIPFDKINTEFSWQNGDIYLRNLIVKNNSMVNFIRNQTDLFLLTIFCQLLHLLSGHHRTGRDAGTGKN